MAHVHTQIRDLVAVALEAHTSLTTVDSNRGKDLLDSDLPAGLVGTMTDSVEPFSKGVKGRGPEERRTVGLTVTIVVRGESETLDDDLDALRAEIEPVVDDALLSSIAIAVRHTGGEMDMGADEDGHRWFAFLALSWDVEVITEVRKPEMALI
jgi:hypothetical protein